MQDLSFHVDMKFIQGGLNVKRLFTKNAPNLGGYDGYPNCVAGIK